MFIRITVYVPFDPTFVLVVMVIVVDLFIF